MKIELKKIKTFDGMEGIGYNGDVYINGKNVGQAIDDGSGGGISLRFYNEMGSPLQKLTEEAEAWATKQPDTTVVIDKDIKFTFKTTLETIVEGLFEEYLLAKEAAKKERMGKKYIQYGVPNGFSYSQVSWKGKSLAEMASTPQGKMTVEIRLKQLKKNLKPNEVIFNEEYLKSLGLTF